MSSLEGYKRYGRQQAELPIRVKQLSRSLEHLAEITYRQLPFARAEKETPEAYKVRIEAYFDKLYAIEKELFAQLPEADQIELAEAFAAVDMQCKECLRDLEKGNLGPTQDELLEMYETQEAKFAAYAEDPLAGEAS